MTVLEMLTEIGDKLDDPGGDRFDPTKKREFLDQAVGRLIILLLAFGQVGLAGEDLLGVLLTESGEVTPQSTGVALVPEDFLAYRKNKRGEPIIEIGGKIARSVRNPGYKDLLGRAGSTQYADEDNPAFYEERGGVISFPGDLKVVFHYVREPESFMDLKATEECELPRILHPILVQDAIKTAAVIDGEANIANGAAIEYRRLITKLITGVLL